MPIKKHVWNFPTIYTYITGTSAEVLSLYSYAMFFVGVNFMIIKVISSLTGLVVCTLHIALQSVVTHLFSHSLFFNASYTHVYVMYTNTYFTKT